MTALAQLARGGCGCATVERKGGEHANLPDSNCKQLNRGAIWCATRQDMRTDLTALRQVRVFSVSVGAWLLNVVALVKAPAISYLGIAARSGRHRGQVNPGGTNWQDDDCQVGSCCV